MFDERRKKEEKSQKEALEKEEMSATHPCPLLHESSIVLLLILGILIGILCQEVLELVFLGFVLLHFVIVVIVILVVLLQQTKSALDLGPAGQQWVG